MDAVKHVKGVTCFFNSS